MSPRRYQLDGASLVEVRDKVVDQYGPDARIVSVEQVTTGGLGGFFASRRYQVTIEVPDRGAATESVAAHHLDGSTRIGLAALLADADDAETQFGAGAHAEQRAAEPEDDAPQVSTGSREFAKILDELHHITELPDLPRVNPTAMPPAAPRLYNSVGDLVVVAGRPADALAVARAMSFTVPAEVNVAGAAVAEGLARINGRRDAITARARGVEKDRIVIVAYGLNAGQPASEQAAGLAELRADQLWLAVDAGRKAEDTARWVTALSASAHPDGIAGVGAETTATPETLRELGLPVSWEYDV